MDESGKPIRLQLLGAAHLQAGAAGARRLERRRAALLALLAVEGEVARARIIELVFSDLAPDNALNSLRQQINKLRHYRDGAVIEAGEASLRLAPGVRHDLVEWQGRLDTDAAAGCGVILADDDYTDLPDFGCWLAQARRHHAQRRRGRLIEIAGQLQAASRYREALPYADELAAMSIEARFVGGQALEQDHLRLMQLHYLNNDAAAAIDTFDRCREQLQQLRRPGPGPELVALAKLIRASQRLPGQAVVLPPTVWRPPRLVGRQSEMDFLDLARSQRRVVLILGEPGIGKSRLMADQFESVSGAPAMVGARHGDAAVPYTLFCRLAGMLQKRGHTVHDDLLEAELCRLLPEYGRELSGVLQPVLLLRAMAALIDAGVGQTPVVVIDDLQFADAASLEGLPALIAATRSEMTWLLAARAGDVPPSIAEWIASQDVDGLAVLRLAPLDEQGVHDLLVSLSIDGLDAATLAKPMWRHTGGNPLFVLETLRAKLTETDGRGDVLPASRSIGELLQRQFGRLSTAALKLLRLAAVAGSDFDGGLVVFVLGGDPLDHVDAWNELKAAQILGDTGFAHDLVFEAARASVPLSLATLLHARIAQYLKTQCVAAARIAAHLQAAQQWADSAAFWERAATEAKLRSRRDEQRDCLQAATGCWSRAGDANAAFAARCGLASVLAHVEGPHAANLLTVELATTAVGDRQRLNALLVGCEVGLIGGRFADLLAPAQEALALATQLGEIDLALEAAVRLSYALSYTGRGAKAMRVLDEAEARAGGTLAASSRYELGAARLAAVMRSSGARAALPVAKEVVDLARVVGDADELVTALGSLGGVHGTLGQLAPAVELLEQAVRLQRNLGHSRAVTRVAEFNLGLFTLALGRFSDALAHLASALDAFRAAEMPAWMHQCEAALALLYLRLGQRKRAMESLTTPKAELIVTAQARRLLVQARIEQDAGRNGADAVHQAMKVLAGTPESLLSMVVAVEAAALEPVDTAVPRLEQLVRHAADHDVQQAVLLANLRLAQRLLGKGPSDADAAAAARAAEAAVSIAIEVQSAEIYAAEVSWTAYQAALAAGRLDLAQKHLAAGQAWVRQAQSSQVPEPFRDSFARANQINARLLGQRRVPRN